MRLTRAKKAADPDTHAIRDSRIVRAVHGREVGIKEFTQVLADLFGNDVFLKLLPNAGGIYLVSFDDAVDGAVNRFLE